MLAPTTPMGAGVHGGNAQLFVPGTVVDGYVLEQQLGQGGMGVVWRARHPTLGRTAAIKFLRAELVGDDNSKNRFLRETRIAAQVSHDRVVAIWHAGLWQGSPFLVQEFMAGGDLSQRLHDYPDGLPGDLAARWWMDAITGMAALHAGGLIHRDIKPQNLLIDEDERVCVADLGLARALGAGGTLTAEGHSPGTPAFMAPEQMAGQRVDARADVYALGVTGYMLWCGRPPHMAKTYSELFAQVQVGAITPLATVRPGVPLRIAGLIHRCLERDPARRPADARELLALVQEERPAISVVQPMRSRRVAGTLSLIVVLLAVAWGVRQHQVTISRAVPPSSPEKPAAVVESQTVATAQAYQAETPAATPNSLVAPTVPEPSKTAVPTAVVPPAAPQGVVSPKQDSSLPVPAQAELSVIKPVDHLWPLDPASFDLNRTFSISLVRSSRRAGYPVGPQIMPVIIALARREADLSVSDSSARAPRARWAAWRQSLIDDAPLFNADGLGTTDGSATAGAMMVRILARQVFCAENPGDATLPNKWVQGSLLSPEQVRDRMEHMLGSWNKVAIRGLRSGAWMSSGSAESLLPICDGRDLLQVAAWRVGGGLGLLGWKSDDGPVCLLGLRGDVDPDPAGLQALLRKTDSLASAGSTYAGADQGRVFIVPGHAGWIALTWVGLDRTPHALGSPQLVTSADLGQSLVFWIKGQLSPGAGVLVAAISTDRPTNTDSWDAALSDWQQPSVSSDIIPLLGPPGQ